MNTNKELKFIVEEALNMLYEYDYHLIENKLHEQCMVFRFGLYFHKLIQKTIYADFDLDLEYNKNINNSKYTKHNSNGIRPDLILHERGNNENNILILEFKKTERSRKKDINKLEDLTSITQGYKYSLGGSILLTITRKDVEVDWYEG